VLQQRLPNFFLVGTGKAGTTSLHRYLQQHPQIYMSPVKEPCYFASEIRREALSTPFQKHIRHRPGRLATDRDTYLALFESANGHPAVGEASAAYLWSETAAGNIYAEVPDARIVIMLRDPAERAYSQYMHQLAAGLIKSSFREHINRCVENRSRALGVCYPFLEVGMYSEQVGRFLDRFPREQVRIYWFEEAWKDPSGLMRDLFEFLGVDSTFRPDTSERYLSRRAPLWPALHHFLKESELWYPLRTLLPPALRRLAFTQNRVKKMDPADRAFLVDYYREDIGRLSSLLNRDLSPWLRV